MFIESQVTLFVESGDTRISYFLIIFEIICQLVKRMWSHENTECRKCLTQKKERKPADMLAAVSMLLRTHLKQNIQVREGPSVVGGTWFGVCFICPNNKDPKPDPRLSHRVYEASSRTSDPDR